MAGETPAKAGPKTRAAKRRNTYPRSDEAPRQVAAEAEATALATVHAPAEAAPVRRIVRWSIAREDLFVTTLAETLNVTQSCSASGLSSGNVYRRFHADPPFRARWRSALTQGYLQLETDVLARAIKGRRKSIWRASGKVGSELEFDDRNALLLLRFHHARAHGADAAPDAELSAAELRARFDARISAMNRALGGDG